MKRTVAIVLAIAALAAAIPLAIATARDDGPSDQRDPAPKVTDVTTGAPQQAPKGDVPFRVPEEICAAMGGGFDSKSNPVC